jgi:hypothetical protein
MKKRYRQRAPYMPAANIVTDQTILDITPLCATCISPAPFDQAIPNKKKLMHLDEFLKNLAFSNESL